VTRYLADHQLPVGTSCRRGTYQAACAYLAARLGPGQWLEKEINNSYHLNRPLLAQYRIELAHAQQVLAEFLRDQPGIT